MRKLLLPAGMIALLLSALTLSAQVRQAPTQSAPPPSTTSQKAVPSQPGATRTEKKPSKTTTGESKSARRRRKRNHVYLGVCTVAVEDMPSRVRRKLKLNNTEGVIVVEVMPDSPAEEVGLKHGDVITHVNGKLIEDEDELTDDLNKVGPDKPVKLSICRDGKKQEVTAELEEGSAHQEWATIHGQSQGWEPERYGNEFETEDRMPGREHQLLERINHLERRLYNLENRIHEMEQNRSVRR